MNPLLQSSLVLGTWRERLTRISASLYAGHFAEWQHFEPERKRLDECLSFLEYEGLISPHDPVNRVLETLYCKLENSRARWTAACEVAERALGTKKLLEIIGS